MTTLKTLTKRHAVLVFFVLAFVISWVGIMVIVGPGAFPGASEQVERLFLYVMLAWLAGPSVASIVMTAFVDGKAGLRALLTRMTRWRVKVRWYAIALLLAPLMWVGVALALSLTSPAFLPGILTTNDKAPLLLMGLGYGLIGGGFLEELGWTGFAIPKLRQGYSIFGTGMIVGILWGAYHFSVIFWAMGSAGALELGLILPFQLFAWLPAFRVLMVWVYEHTQSLLVAMLMHASLTAGMLILQPLGMSGMTLLAWLLAWAAAWWMVVAVVALISHRQFLQPPLYHEMGTASR